MNKSRALALGLDFGTESVRALLVDLRGREVGSAVAKYRHGQITRALPVTNEKLPPDFALQHPGDWLDSAGRAVRAALRQSSARDERVISIGVDFTSCTMLPALADGTPLCLTDRFAGEKHAWPKLWKHHAAKTATDRINAVARRRNEKWLKRYGGIVGLEWFFPKVLETLTEAPHVYDAAEVWLEAGDWFVWQLVGGAARDLPRSTCQAGYKAMWGGEDGYPSCEFFRAVNRRMTNVVEQKMPGRLLAPGMCAGHLTPAMAKRLNLLPGAGAGIAVSAAVIDAHAGVPGAGVAHPGALVMVMGTSSCHMINAKRERLIDGVAGVVRDGILPGFYGYETGQAAVGDAFDWLRRTVGERDFARLSAAAAQLPPGSDGLLCIDWFNGCRTPLMNGNLRGAFTGLTLNHGPEHLYRSLLEASAFGLRWIVELLRDGGVPVKRFVATGGLPHHIGSELIMQVYADVLGETIAIHPSRHGPALGAAILGVLAAGREITGFRSASDAIASMAGESAHRRMRITTPDHESSRAYRSIYRRYRDLADSLRTS